MIVVDAGAPVEVCSDPRLYAAAAASWGCGLVTTDGGLATTAADQFGITVTHVPATGAR